MENENTRKCPQCNRILTYSSKGMLNRAKRNESLCIHCSQSNAQKSLTTEEELRITDAYKNKTTTDKELCESLNINSGLLRSILKRHKVQIVHILRPTTRPCPKCGKVLQYKDADSCKKANQRNNLCKRCGYDARSPIPIESRIRAGATIRKNTEEKYKNEPFRKIRQSFADYKKRVYQMTRVICKHKGIECSPGHHIDHKFPIKLGFKYAIPPMVIADVPNLQVITATENMKKSAGFPKNIPTNIIPYLLNDVNY